MKILTPVCCDMSQAHESVAEVDTTTPREKMRRAASLNRNALTRSVDDDDEEDPASAPAPVLAPTAAAVVGGAKETSI